MNAQGNFITAVCRDLSGHVWIGTEDGQGLWSYDPAAKLWTHFPASTDLSGDIYALACDKKGRLWAGGLAGVSVYNGKQWRQYGPTDGPLGTRLFALAVSPKDGGVWGATEAGLFRYGNDRWNYYTRADGLPSDQASSLAFAPDGTLYVGTQCDGLAVGSPTNDYKTWRLTPAPERAANQGRGSGLPISQINALLVARSGAVFCGTTAGLARSDDGGQTWRFRRGADWLDKGSGRYDAGLAQEAKISGIEVLPLGLPAAGEKSLAVNAAGKALGRFAAMRGFVGGSVFTSQNAVDTKGVADAAPPALYQSERWGNCSFTASGLKPLGSYRVRLHLAELSQTAPGKRLFNVFAGGQPVLTRLDIFGAACGLNKALVKEFPAHADRAGHLVLQFQGSAPSGVDTGGGEELAEDYVTSLSEDGAGHLLVGHRQKGLEVWDETREARLFPGAKDAASSDYVFALLPLQSGGVLVGRYGGGLARQDVPVLVPPKAIAVAAAPADAPPLPLPAAPPTAAELGAMLARVQSLKGEIPVGGGAYLGEDWQTLGDWVGHYGRQYAVLCADASPLDQVLTWNSDYVIEGQMGPHHGQDETLRHWLQPGMINTDRLASLYSPVNGFRAQAEWDDHGEVYPQTFEGPDVWVGVTVPEGIHRLSLYDTNKDAHTWEGNRNRDYLVDLLPYRAKMEDAMSLPPLAHARIHDFWNGMYTSFVVRGPAKYYLRVGKNNSLNTILAGVFIDKLAGPITHLDEAVLPFMHGIRYDPADPDAPLPTSNIPLPLSAPLTPEQTEHLNMARALWSALNASSATSAVTSVQQPYRLLDYRTAVGSDGSDRLLENWRWTLHLWINDDRVWFDRNMELAAILGRKRISSHP